MFNDYALHLTVLPTDIDASPEIDQKTLSESYDYCMDLFKLHAKSFYFASRYLEEHERKSMAALYAFCRLADDFADEIDIPKDRLEVELDRLLEITEKLATGVNFNHPIFIAFGDTMRKYSIPLRYVQELIEGVRMDINLIEVRTTEELDKYCYHVASTVGIMMCHVWGADNPDTLERAADLGRAMQLTNILRDVAEDFENGRIYIPLETRSEFRIGIDDFKNRSTSPNFKWMIRSLISRADSLYAKAEIGIADLPPRAQFTVKVASRVYGEIMNVIKDMDYDVWSRRAVVPKWKKLWIAFKARGEYKKELKDYAHNLVEEPLVAAT
ncbi:MAG: phytoene/squalene synthase family protein [Candidatus Thorarchaeota archaeon]|nr:MAG: phytoene/squalene synthase family protein [Candidatus Thorarchaeota archaeon]